MNEKGEKIKIFLEVEPDTEVTIKPIAAELAQKSMFEGNVTTTISGTYTLASKTPPIDVDHWSI